MLQKLQFVLIF